MKTTWVPLFLACASAAQAATVPVPSADPTADVLYAIRMVESGNRYADCPTGRHGEQGPYQFRREVWHQYTHAPFSAARTSLADEIARRHYAWLAQCLRRGGQTPTPWAAAAAWNGGVAAVLRNRITAGTRNYATRVTNLVESQAQVRAALTPRFRIDLANN